MTKHLMRGEGGQKGSKSSDIIYVRPLIFLNFDRQFTLMDFIVQKKVLLKKTGMQFQKSQITTR